MIHFDTKGLPTDMDHTRNRLDMLHSLSFIGKENMNLFNEYIPDRYDEIYTLYSLLDKSGIHYRDIAFARPKSNASDFTFVGSTETLIIDKIFKFISKHNNEIKYMRNKTFYVNITETKTGVFAITFSPIYHKEA